MTAGCGSFWFGKLLRIVPNRWLRVRLFAGWNSGPIVKPPWRCTRFYASSSTAFLAKRPQSCSWILKPEGKDTDVFNAPRQCSPSPYTYVRKKGIPARQSVSRKRRLAAATRHRGRYAPQDSRTTKFGLSKKFRAGSVGSLMRSSIARKAVNAMSRHG